MSQSPNCSIMSNLFCPRIRNQHAHVLIRITWKGLRQPWMTLLLILVVTDGSYPIERSKNRHTIEKELYSNFESISVLTEQKPDNVCARQLWRQRQRESRMWICLAILRKAESSFLPSESGKSDDSHDFNFRPFLTDTDYDCVDEIGFSAAAASVDVVRGMTGVPGLTWGWDPQDGVVTWTVLT